MNSGRLDIVLAITEALTRANIAHTLTQYRDDAVSIQAAVPGERWEIDVTTEGEVEFERFVSTGSIADRTVLESLIAKHSDSAAEVAE